MKKYIKTSIIRNLLDEDMETLTNLASTSTNPRVLSQLASMDDTDIRCRVAANPATPANILKQVVDWEHMSTVVNVIMNPSTPTEILKEIIDVVKTDANMPIYLKLEFTVRILEHPNADDRLRDECAYRIRTYR